MRDNFPYYRIDGHNRLVRNGTFISGRPFLTSLDVWLSKSALVHFLRRRVGLPNISEEDVRLTAKIIEESRNVFSERFHSRRFYVVIYPFAGRYFKESRDWSYLKRA